MYTHRILRLGRKFITKFTSSIYCSVVSRNICAKHVLIFNEFITKEEEKVLYEEVHSSLKRMRYIYDHWDNAIHGYRETEKSVWSDVNKGILDRMKDMAFKDTETPTMSHVHVLDIDKEGYIKPHVDSVRFCGSTIAGISLLSNSVMRLTHVTEEDLAASLLLKRRSLYILKDDARYDFKHEILKEDESMFRGDHIPRDRRISIIMRTEPDPERQENS